MRRRGMSGVYAPSAAQRAWPTAKGERSVGTAGRGGMSSRGTLCGSADWRRERKWSWGRATAHTNRRNSISRRAAQALRKDAHLHPAGTGQEVRRQGARGWDPNAALLTAPDGPGALLSKRLHSCCQRLHIVLQQKQRTHFIATPHRAHHRLPHCNQQAPSCQPQAASSVHSYL